ncbi:MAG: hypothetical protein ACRENE_11170 [Polyangiaceae bacterium]
MIRTWIRALAALLFVLATAPPARAQQSPTPGRPVVIALIVTNNRSAELGRPELRYADDDGAKYYELFRMVADSGAVELLTDFDADTARLFPEARGVAHEPTRRDVTDAIARLSAQAATATRAGRPIEFYFVFAGHGDVDRGRGFLELRDARLTSDDIEAMLKAIPSTHAHVILDSCNSFFVLNPRRPGGRQLAVTEEAARSLSARLPNVGVLLSTSAEAEVFEWSELQSGIFSHAVRSGLMGAADVNSDGRVTYDEIRAFVDVASARVENPLYRPKVFARGPNGKGDEPLFDLTAAQSVRLDLDTREHRVTVRDARELRLIDAYKEAGAPATLHLPLGRAAGASIDERDPRRTGMPVVARRPVDVATTSGGEIQLASLQTVSPEARGANELLSNLFAEPFGPRAFAQWREQAAHEAEPVYGISSEDGERMRLLLHEVADVQRRGRQGAGMFALTAGAIFASGGTWMLADHQLPVADPQVLGYTLIGEGVAFAATGAVLLGIHGDGERLYNDYLRAVATPPVDGARIVAQTERRFFYLADRARHVRAVMQPVGWILVGLSAAGFVAEQIEDHDAARRLELGVVAGCVGFAGISVATLGSIPSPVELLADVWSNDPSIQRLPRTSGSLQVSIAPLRGGAALGVGGAL